MEKKINLIVNEENKDFRVDVFINKNEINNDIKRASADAETKDSCIFSNIIIIYFFNFS